MSTSLQLEAKETALVVIDMQNGVLQLPCQPYSPDAVLDNVVQLADAFRAKGAFVVLVNVDSRDGGDMLRPITDAPPLSRGERPKDYAQIAAPLGPKPTDHLVTKHNWGAFYGTDLDLQLRRRGITTIVLCGIATGIGVETTAREALQHNYQQVFAEDAMTALSAAEHAHSVGYIFPRMGRVRKTAEIIEALR